MGITINDINMIIINITCSTPPWKYPRYLILAPHSSCKVCVSVCSGMFMVT